MLRVAPALPLDLQRRASVTQDCLFHCFVPGYQAPQPTCALNSWQRASAGMSPNLLRHTSALHLESRGRFLAWLRPDGYGLRSNTNRSYTQCSLGPSLWMMLPQIPGPQPRRSMTGSPLIPQRRHPSSPQRLPKASLSLPRLRNTLLLKMLSSGIHGCPSHPQRPAETRQPLASFPWA